MKKLPKLFGVALSTTALVLASFAGVAAATAAETPDTDAVENDIPSLWREYQDYFIMGTFGGWESEKQLKHYRTSSPSNDLKLDSQIGGNWMNGNNPTYREYEAAIAEINADADLSAEEKATKIEEANQQIVLQQNTNGERTLQAIQEYNRINELPDEEKKVVRGHVLAWHGGQQPMWFFCDGFYYDQDDPQWANPETMLKRLDNYIRLMMEKYSQYSDIIYQWDVVNEPVDDYTGQIRNMDDAQQGQWGNIFRRADLEGDARLQAESEWVRQAFASARKWSDEYGADWKLYFNDFQDSNKPYEPKLSQTIKVLKPIYEAGNIDGYGMQGRLAWAAPSIEQLKRQIDLGLTVADEIAITESDVRSDFEPNPNYDPSQPSYRVTEPGSDTRSATQLEWPEGSCSWDLRGNSNGNTFDVCNSPVRRMEEWGPGQNVELAATPEIMRKQADFAADWMDLLISYGDKITAYQWDGVADNSTFNRETGGHLWAGTEGNPEKYSFFAVIGAPARAKLRDALGVQPYEAGLYTKSSWEAYAAAKSAGERIANERVYTLDDVTAVKAATQTLGVAYAALQTQLSALYSEWSGADLSSYTYSTAAAVTAALEAARRVVDDPDAGAETISTAHQVLRDAVNGLAVRASESQLSALRSAVELGAKDEAKPQSYTVDTFEALAKALANARSLLANPGDASAVEVEDAIASLTKAIASLKTTEKPSEVKPAVVAPVDKADTAPGLVNTGAISPAAIAGIALLVLVSSLGLLVARRRGRQ